MTWKIRDMNNGGSVIETHDKPREAQRALMILSAHEIKNGRQANYRIDPPIDLDPIELLDLPQWALDALENNPSA